MSEHTQSDKSLEALLPFYVNGTLEGSEHEQVEQWLQQSDAARALEQEYRLLQKSVQEFEGAQPDVVSDFGWARLQKQLQPIAQQQSTDRSAWWRAGAIAAALLLAVQTGYIGLGSVDGQPSVRLLSAGSSYDASEYHLLQVRFSAKATSLQIQNALDAMHGQIVAGPSASGLYRILVSKDGLPAIDKTWLQQMRANPAIEHLQLEETD